MTSTLTSTSSPLAYHFEDLFESDIRRRGERYRAAGRVVELEPTDDGFEATVDGTRPYRVMLALVDDDEGRGRSGAAGAVTGAAAAGGGLLACDCPYFEKNGPCKHLWAALLEADRRASGLGPTPPQGMVAKAPWVEDPSRAPLSPLPRMRDLAPATTDEVAEPEGGAEPTPRERWQQRMDELDRLAWEKFGPAPGEAGQGEAGQDDAAAQVGEVRESELRFRIDLRGRFVVSRLEVAVEWRRRRAEGRWSEWEPFTTGARGLRRLTDPDDRRLMAILMQTTTRTDHGLDRQFEALRPAEYEIDPAVFELLLPRLRDAGKTWVLRAGRAGEDEEVRSLLGPLLPEPVYEFELAARRSVVEGDIADGEEDSTEPAEEWVFEGALVPAVEEASGGRRPGTIEFERIGADEIAWVHAGGLVGLTDGVIYPARFSAGDLAWLEQLEEEGALRVPVDETAELMDRLWSLPEPSRFELPEELRVEDVVGTPRPVLRLRIEETVPHPRAPLPLTELHWELWFSYGDDGFRWRSPVKTALHGDARQRLHRDPEAELAFVDELDTVLDEFLLNHGRGRDHHQGTGEGSVRIGRDHAGKLVELLGGLSAQWIVTLDGQRLHREVQPEFRVASGVDWFQLDRSVTLRTSAGDTDVDLPVLLQAVNERRPLEVGGQQVLLPTDLQNRLQAVGSMIAEGSGSEEGMRLGTSQLFVLEALLTSGGGEAARLQLDETCRRLRDSLRTFEGIESLEPPPGFVGELRDYQKLGLGWMWFLRQRGLGGCLADDMGLGKTVQVLALFECVLEQRVADGEEHLPRPFLVVAPKSVVPNWIAEAARFLPDARVVDFTGPDRRERLTELQEDLEGTDVGRRDGAAIVVTTYSSMRIDVTRLLRLEFDTVVLDEAQAIKNPQSKTAQAARRLRAKHRLALTGTPVENHLGDIASIFRFLNPGMVEHLPALRALAHPKDPHASLELASAALRPMVLRRTKDEVLEELPEKTEQTLYCELSGRERQRYDELASYYRGQLLGADTGERLGRKKFLALEALLRLRQAASHQGLLLGSGPDSNGDRAADLAQATEQGSAKLDFLTERVEEVLEEPSHKALVFSQFTSLLAFVRERFDRHGWRYAYLDGSTTRRAEVVREFQEDPECRLFLISLKAGGVGLNLTAADYVFLLDPWWNPAVEQQAIDRAHRIGQTRPVVAYRLLTKDTVEERVAELQDRKRGLAEALLGADKSLAAKLTKEDLEVLLS